MTGRKPSILSDLDRVDSYVLTDADYEEIPEITDEMMDRAVFGHGEAGLDRAVASILAAKLHLDPDVAAALRASGTIGSAAATRCCATGSGRAWPEVYMSAKTCA